MENPIKVIEKIKSSLEDVILENNLSYLNGNITTLLSLYSADLCGILLGFYPGATIMMHNNNTTCAILIGGVIYDSNGVVKDVLEYHVAQEWEIGFIQKSFHQLSDDVMTMLTDKLLESQKLPIVYSLRKNRDELT